VVVNVQRSGPSTGLATKPAQADLLQTRWGRHGDQTLIALCPATAAECFSLTVAAFNLAERFRVPVVLLADEIVGHLRENVTLPARARWRSGTGRARPGSPRPTCPLPPARPRCRPWPPSGAPLSSTSPAPCTARTAPAATTRPTPPPRSPGSTKSSRPTATRSSSPGLRLRRRRGAACRPGATTRSGREVARQARRLGIRAGCSNSRPSGPSGPGDRGPGPPDEAVWWWRR
jgi:hypothetical protein